MTTITLQREQELKSSSALKITVKLVMLASVLMVCSYGLLVSIHGAIGLMQ